MNVMDLTSSTTTVHGRRLLAACACALMLTWVAAAGSAHAQTAGSSTGQSGDGNAAPVVSASLVQCVTATEQAERAATFSGEMAMIPGAARMSMRIELLERAPGETGYHYVIAPGLGVWRTAEPSVKSYKYLKQVTNLSAPAAYKGLVSFRWQGPKGHTIRREERRTHRCAQPAPELPPASPPLE